MHWYLLVLLQQIKDAVNPKPRTAGKDRVPPAQWFVSMQGVEFLHDFVLTNIVLHFFQSNANRDMHAEGVTQVVRSLTALWPD